MPKRMKDRNKSIFVKFKEEYSDKEINKFLNSLSVQGTRVSTLINRWVVEIPFWKEGQITEKMLDSELVNVIHENFDIKRKNFTEESENENDE